MTPLTTQLTNLYFNRLKIHIARNGITFIGDVRDRERWTLELLRMGETSTMEELPTDSVMGKMRQLMYDNGLDLFDQRRLIFDLFDGDVAWL